MFRTLKIIVMILGTLMLLCILVVTCSGYVITKGITTIANKEMDAAMDAGPQDSAVTADGITITKALEKRTVLLFNGVELCTPKGQFSFSTYSQSSTCTNGNCVATIDFHGEPVLDTLIINRKYNGDCISQTIPHASNYKITEYGADINISPEVSQKLGVIDPHNTSPQKTAASEYTASNVMKHGNNTTVTLYYGGATPKQDEFMFGSKLVRIHYNSIGQ